MALSLLRTCGCVDVQVMELVCEAACTLFFKQQQLLGPAPSCS
jgi:hypothetical protein